MKEIAAATVVAGFARRRKNIHRLSVWLSLWTGTDSSCLHSSSLIFPRSIPMWKLEREKCGRLGSASAGSWFRAYFLQPLWTVEGKLQL